MIARNFARVTFTSDNRADLGKVAVPTLILQSREDSIAPRQVFDELVVSNAEMRLVERKPMNDHLERLLDPLTDIDQRLYKSAVMLFKTRAEGMRLEQHVPSGLEVRPLSRRGRS